MQRQISNTEIQKAHELYLEMSKPYVDKINEINQWLVPKIVKTETEVKVFYEETEEIVMLRKALDELAKQINSDLNKGLFL